MRQAKEDLNLAVSGEGSTEGRWRPRTNYTKGSLNTQTMTARPQALALKPLNSVSLHVSLASLMPPTLRRSPG